LHVEHLHTTSTNAKANAVVVYTGLGKYTTTTTAATRTTTTTTAAADKAAGPFSSLLRQRPSANLGCIWEFLPDVHEDWLLWRASAATAVAGLQQRGRLCPRPSALGLPLGS